MICENAYEGKLPASAVLWRIHRGSARHDTPVMHTVQEVFTRQVITMLGTPQYERL